MTAEEVVGLEAWTTPAQRALFAAMPVADQRHGLDVAAHLRRQGVTDTDVLVAGLLHDAGKGHAGRVWHRIAWSLSQRYGARMWRLAAGLPGFADHKIAHEATKTKRASPEIKNYGWAICNS